MKRMPIGLTTKLFTLEAVVFLLTLTAFILTIIAYLQDARWDYKERALFRAKYEFWHQNHKLEAEKLAKHGPHVHVGDDITDDRHGHLIVNPRTPEHTDPKDHIEHNLHDHQFSPRYEGTAITSMILTLLACIACGIELGLSFRYKNARIRRITVS
jgi:hypothetical protein